MTTGRVGLRRATPHLRYTDLKNDQHWGGIPDHLIEDLYSIPLEGYSVEVLQYPFGGVQCGGSAVNTLEGYSVEVLL